MKSSLLRCIPFKRIAMGVSVSAAVLLAVTAVPASVVHVASRADGLTFVYSITSASTDKRTREAIDRVSTVRIQNGNVRMDYTLGSPMPGQKGLYLLILADTKKFAIVK